MRGILVGRTRVGVADIGVPLGNRQESRGERIGALKKLRPMD